MVTEKGTVQRLMRGAEALLAGALALGMVACAAVPLGGPSPADARMEQQLANLQDQIESNNRQSRNSLEQLNGKLDEHSEKIQTLVDDVNRQLRQQQQDIKKIQDDVSALSPTPTPAPGGGDSGFGSGTVPGATPFVQALANGKMAYDQGNYPAANEAFMTALGYAKSETDPEKGKDEQIQANYWLGETSFALKDYATAEQNYKTAIRINPQRLAAWQSFERLADIDIIRGNKGAAMEKLNNILEAWKSQGQRYPGEDQVRSKIAQIQSGAPMGAPGGEVAPAPPAAGPPPAGPPPMNFGQGQ